MGVVVTLHSLSEISFEKMKKEKKYPENFASKSTYVDKSWEIIPFILTNSVRPLENNVLSEIIHPKNSYVINPAEPDYMHEYIPFSTPDRVMEINKKLHSITENDFRALFNLREFKPGIMYVEAFEDKSEETFNYLKNYFLAIKSLFEYAANNDEFVVISIE